MLAGTQQEGNAVAGAKFVRQAPALETPIGWLSNGAARVLGTRVPLEFVIWSHKQGMHPGEIVDRYPTLELADVYAVIAYYLRNSEEVETYLQEADEAAEKAYAEWQATNPDPGFRERVRARQKAMQKERQAS